MRNASSEAKSGGGTLPITAPSLETIIHLSWNWGIKCESFICYLEHPAVFISFMYNEYYLEFWSRRKYMLCLETFTDHYEEQMSIKNGSMSSWVDRWPTGALDLSTKCPGTGKRSLLCCIVYDDVHGGIDVAGEGWQSVEASGDKKTPCVKF